MNHAPRSRLLALIVLEAGLLSMTGAVAGIAAGHALTAFAAPWIEASAGVRLDSGLMLPTEALLLLAITVTGCQRA